MPIGRRCGADPLAAKSRIRESGEVRGWVKKVDSKRKKVNVRKSWQKVEVVVDGDTAIIKVEDSSLVEERSVQIKEEAFK